MGGINIDSVLADAFSRILFEDVADGHIYTNYELLEMIFSNEIPDSNHADLYLKKGMLCLLFTEHRTAGSSVEIGIDFNDIPDSVWNKRLSAVNRRFMAADTVAKV